MSAQQPAFRFDSCGGAERKQGKPGSAGSWRDLRLLTARGWLQGEPGRASLSSLPSQLPGKAAPGCMKRGPSRCPPAGAPPPATHPRWRGTARSPSSSAHAPAGQGAHQRQGRALALRCRGGQRHVPRAARPAHAARRTCCSLPATSSRRAAAIQPGACRGLVWMTDLSSSRAFLMSLISASAGSQGRVGSQA